MALKLDRKKIISWSLYDWANSAFATSVMAGFFPVFFKDYWSSGTSPSISTFHLGIANGLACTAIAAIAPLLGAIADKAGARKKFLLFFVLLGVVMTCSLCFISQGNWRLAAGIYVFAIIGFYGGNIFYDSLIVDVSPEEKFDFVSALGYSLGYLGGGLLFALNVVMVIFPRTFGFTNNYDAIRITFLLVAVWWAVFSIPIFIFVKEHKSPNKLETINIVSSGFRQFCLTFREIRKLKVVFLFLLGYWLYIDGVDTIILMAVDYGMSIGLSSTSLILALFITQCVGCPAALVFGKIGEKMGAKTGIVIGIGVYVAVTIWGSFMRREAEFYILAVIIGLVQGGVQSLSRSFYAKIVPKNKAAEFFGFYNMLGKFAAVMGPIFIGWVSFLTGNPRYSILTLLLLFIPGAIILSCVDEKAGKQKARELESVPDAR